MQKTNFKTRLLALLTAVFMVIMCVPFAAFADAAEVTVSFNRLNSDPVYTPYLTQVLTEANPESSPRLCPRATMLGLVIARARS